MRQTIRYQAGTTSDVNLPLLYAQAGGGFGSKSGCAAATRKFARLRRSFTKSRRPYIDHLHQGFVGAVSILAIVDRPAAVMTRLVIASAIFFDRRYHGVIE